MAGTGYNSQERRRGWNPSYREWSYQSDERGKRIVI